MNSHAIHIRCGDDILPILRENSPGRAIRWADPLSEGPPRAARLPGNNDARTATDLEARIEFLCADYGSAPDDARSYLLEQDRNLLQLVADSNDEGRITLWFEHDLFDHVILLYLLNCLAERGFAQNDRVELIQIDRHASIQPPRIFHGLGQLSPADIVALYSDPGPTVLNSEHWRSAHIAWQAWLHSTPEKIEAIAAGTEATPGFPFLAAAFARHLREFPAQEHGLGETEVLILQALQDGDATSVAGLFRYYNARDALLGLGDLMFWPRIAGLAFVARPLIACSFQDGRSIPTRAQFLEGCQAGKLADLQAILISLTDFGREVLAGRADHVAANGINCWRGGVRLKTPENLWRWDAVSNRMRPGS
ncbi:MAG: DUF1835 domain-containing protein [bacterium]|nr:DUF1835 domain-containing protein [bacterium]